MNISGSRIINIVIVLCLPLPSAEHLSFISKSSQKGRISFKKKLYRRLLSINGIIRILMRVIRLTNGKPCMCYYTCGYIIFMTWIISLNDFTVM